MLEPPSNGPPTTLADRLRAHRERRFAGRAAELEAFRGALTAANPPFAVLFVHGPGGVGKTTLLDRFELEAMRSGAQCVRIDGRDIAATSEAFVDALRRRLGGADGPLSMMWGLML